MEKNKFIELLEEYLDVTGMDSGMGNAFFEVGDEENVNTTIYIDPQNYIWITEGDSVIRIKTSINISDVTKFRYLTKSKEDFCFICKDNSGLEFVEGCIYYFTNGSLNDSKSATEYFTNNPVS